MEDKRSKKISNIIEQIEKNRNKITKLEVINHELRKVLVDLQSEKPVKVPPTDEQRASQSQMDKQKFYDKILEFKSNQ